MAAKSAISEMTNCSICMKQFDEPKALPCIHTFCLKCLEAYGKDAIPGDELACPLCRQTFHVPPGGLVKLPQNFFIAQMIDVGQHLASDATLSTKQKTGSNCDDCFKNEATKFCVTCQSKKCDGCFAVHDARGDAKSHKAVSLPLDETERAEIYVKTRATYCGEHATEELKFYCYDCDRSLCATCKEVQHKTHKVVDLEAASKEFCKQLKEGYPQLNRGINDNKVKLEKLTENKESLVNKTADCERAIREHGEEIKRLVDAQCTTLLNKLQHATAEKLQIIEKEKEDLVSQLRSAENFKAYVQELTDKGSASVISQSAKNLLTRAEELATRQRNSAREPWRGKASYLSQQKFRTT